jgi:8-oxo-dGTP pyrophosphatase MutT (NUDIX family)
MTDDEILDAVERRFADVETRLPPRRVTIVDSLEVVAARPARIRAGPLSAVLLLVVIGSIVAVGNRLADDARVGAPPSTDASTAVVLPAGTVEPGETPATEPSIADLEIIRGEHDGDSLLIEHYGWGPELIGSDVLIVPPDGARVDAAAERTGIEEGFLELGDSRRVWVGPTAQSAARGFGSPILAIGGRGDTWILQGRLGRQLASFPTPNGRTMWVLTDSVGEAGDDGSR